MKVYEGELGLVGSGTWTDGGGGGKTILSVLEIGNHQLKRVLLPDYLGNYMTPGAHMRVGVSTGLSRGFVTRPVVAAVEVDGKKYKVDQMLFVSLAKIALYAIPAFLIFGSIYAPLGLAAVAAVAWFYLSEYGDLKRF